MKMQVIRKNDVELSTIIPNLAQYDYRILSADRDYSDTESYTEYLEIELTEKTVVAATKEVKENVQMTDTTKLDLNKPIAFTAAPVTTEAPERGQYANKEINVDPKLATEKQVHALIYAISTHDISSKELHLPKTTSITKVAMRYMLDKANSAPKKMHSYRQFTLINNWFAKQYTYYGLATKYYNEFTKEQARVRYDLVNNPQKKLIDAINEEEAQYKKYNF